MDQSSLSCGKLLGAGSSAEPIAIVRISPTGADRHCPASEQRRRVANLAVVLAGKVPVGLNFTSGRAALERAQQIAGLKVAISANAFI
jgi:hypothetical protein